MNPNHPTIRLLELEKQIETLLLMKKERIENLSNYKDIVVVELINTTLRKIQETFAKNVEYINSISSYSSCDVRSFERIDEAIITQKVGDCDSLYDACYELINICKNTQNKNSKPAN
jgi:hypothetical protein